ncbi:MAG: recombinase family protein [Pegethrix bostrychoides GSE-TBD4-15B]|jgi:DNA invertase Pin-like site-specific DNA recombinase|uniref:Recombinase family protein n=1 Tax=Pegethrix bostrychoides GSE-TBD4-15B TaxID=2839662 RepID=A0A951PE69_9CYAN|nr:recombinase family protein [Pegethrix bostrychoides GSE-TBD4-15B]
MPADSRLTLLYSYSDPLLESIPDISTWGWTFDRLYQDLGARTQFQQLLQDCATEFGQQDLQLRVRQLGELGDSLGAIGDCLKQLAQLNVSLLIGEQAAPSELITPAELFGQMDQIQLNQRQQQLRRGHARSRLKSSPPPGSAPYGYRRGKERYLLDRSTAPVVKEFFEHFLLYGSLRGSLRHLQKKYGKKISPATGKHWLTSPVYRGDLTYQTGATIRDTHSPILSRQEAAQIDRLLRRNRSLPFRSASAPRSLAGLVRCATCQSAMKISRTLKPGKAPKKSQQNPDQNPDQAKEYLYLRPVACTQTGSPCRAIPYAEALSRTIQRVCADLLPAIAQVEQQAGLPNPLDHKAQLMAQIVLRQETLTEIPALVTSAILDPETAELRAYKLRTELANLEAKLAQLPPVNLKATAEAVSIPQFWLDLSEPERRFYLREFIQQIQIVRATEDREDRTVENWTVRLIFNFQPM